jgi:hypothetical protein
MRGGGRDLLQARNHEQIAEVARGAIDIVSETERTEITAYYYRATGELNS